jgi:hypothetical protein
MKCYLVTCKLIIDYEEISANFLKMSPLKFFEKRLLDLGLTVEM